MALHQLVHRLVKRTALSYRYWSQEFRRLSQPEVGSVNFGDLGTVTPISRLFGYDRGTPIDRHYIAGFLNAQQELIRGRILEVGDSAYTEQYSSDAVTSCTIVNAVPITSRWAVVADLSNAPHIPDDSFDCIIITQTLHLIYPMEDMVGELHRILTPGGSVLCTVSGIAQISRYDMDRWGDRWRLTDLSARELFETSFQPSDIEVSTGGNVFAATAFLHGLAAEECPAWRLDHLDPDYQVSVMIRATKTDGR